VADRDFLPHSRSRRWTRADDYVVSLARRRSYRRTREPEPSRSEPDVPRFALSTLPFVALFAGLAILTVGIAYFAWPVAQPDRELAQVMPREPGTAAKGWFQDAEREFQR
jgi:hypothetical protein